METREEGTRVTWSQTRTCLLLCPPATHLLNLNASREPHYQREGEARVVVFILVPAIYEQNPNSNMTFSNKAFIYTTIKEIIKLGTVCDLNLLLSPPALNGLLLYLYELITKVYSSRSSDIESRWKDFPWRHAEIGAFGDPMTRNVHKF